jgi:general secretion pathway protein D
MGSFEIVPIKTMNALLVATKWPSMLTLIEDWITAMDHANDSGSNVFVYFV